MTLAPTAVMLTMLVLNGCSPPSPASDAYVAPERVPATRHRVAPANEGLDAHLNRLLEHLERLQKDNYPKWYKPSTPVDPATR